MTCGLEGFPRAEVVASRMDIFEAKAWRNAPGAKRNLVVDICGLGIGGIIERDLLGLGAAYDGLVEAIVCFLTRGCSDSRPSYRWWCHRD